ncbi:MAG: formimidoylglutamase [Bacteroidales bacterium]|nr:formimidoylglutamase [Bacteroidales bacterium]MDD2203849.1 formimidoylglutamase [Bacteroidales bacterium]MDD3152735.1 formimidoylglutamase [Bacteroidales bacterium]MDD3913135.1 formimidoylglutamase [Bacteroidales bacterium]MDD4633050.1 formimidoylglutamase [Bacteroidales bacterium]
MSNNNGKREEEKMITDYYIYLDPVDTSTFDEVFSNSGKLGGIVELYSKTDAFPDVKGANVAILGVPEGHGSDKNQGCGSAPDVIRSQLYNLYNFTEDLKIVDVGNIKQCNSLKDTYFAVKEVVSYFIANKVFVIILGGSNDIAYANYWAYQKLNQLVNFTCFDSCLDIGDASCCPAQAYISKIIMHKPNYLFNYVNIGYQTYLNNSNIVKLIDNLLFDAYRLGLVRNNIEEVEPSIRNSDVASFDISVVKSSDAPARVDASPNGLSSDEFCNLARYVGTSDKISSAGFYEYNPSLDRDFQTAKLIAQAIWCLIDGHNDRLNEYPYHNKNNFIKYHVKSEMFEKEIVFYKSKLTNRWWLEVECPEHLKDKYASCYLVPCSYKDYLSACDNEIPGRWLQVYKKLM